MWVPYGALIHLNPLRKLLLSWPCNVDSDLGIADICMYLTRYLMGPRRKLDLLSREAKDERHRA